MERKEENVYILLGEIENETTLVEAYKTEELAIQALKRERENYLEGNDFDKSKLTYDNDYRFGGYDNAIKANIGYNIIRTTIRTDAEAREEEELF